MSRGVARERERALRIAIGAARGRLIRQLLVENAVLGVLGVGVGLLLASVMLAGMKAFMAHAFMRGGNVQLNPGIIAITMAAGVLSSMGAGVIPAWRASKSNPNQALKSGLATGATRQQHRLRAGFVVTQIALSLALVVFCGLLLLTVRRMLRVDFGFNPKNLLMLGINIPAGDYKGRDYVQDLISPLEAHVQSIPGVLATGSIDQPPILGYGSGTTQQFVGQPPDPQDKERSSESRTVTPGYYAALGLPILEGRNFSAADSPASQPTVMVNDAWVKEFLTSKQDPLIQQFRGTPNMAIIGVARTARQNLPDPARPEIDFPFSQFSLQSQQNADSISICMFVRTAVPL
jgi:putative ABC transport system permease protein